MIYTVVAIAELFICKAASAGHCHETSDELVIQLISSELNRSLYCLILLVFVHVTVQLKYAE